MCSSTNVLVLVPRSTIFTVFQCCAVSFLECVPVQLFLCTLVLLPLPPLSPALCHSPTAQLPSPCAVHTGSRNGVRGLEKRLATREETGERKVSRRKREQIKTDIGTLPEQRLISPPSTLTGKRIGCSRIRHHGACMCYRHDAGCSRRETLRKCSKAAGRTREIFQLKHCNDT